MEGCGLVARSTFVWVGGKLGADKTKKDIKGHTAAELAADPPEWVPNEVICFLLVFAWLLHGLTFLSTASEQGWARQDCRVAQVKQPMRLKSKKILFGRGLFGARFIVVPFVSGETWLNWNGSSSRNSFRAITVSFFLVLRPVV